MSDRLPFSLFEGGLSDNVKKKTDLEWRNKEPEPRYDVHNDVGCWQKNELPWCKNNLST